MIITFSSNSKTNLGERSEETVIKDTKSTFNYSLGTFLLANREKNHVPFQSKRKYRSYQVIPIAFRPFYENKHFNIFVEGYAEKV